MMCNYKKLFEELLTSRNGIEVDSIHFVSDEIYVKDEREKLSYIGLESYEPIYFSNKELQYPPKMGLKSLSNMRGATICIRNDSKIKQVIFLPKDVAIIGTNLHADSYEELKSLFQLCSLLHELGHVEDMQKSINFSLGDKPTIQLLKAEAYAHAYALNFLNQAGATIARNMLADALYKLNQSNRKFDKNLYQQISVSIGKGRLKKWMKA
ncbi:MAG: hypothetical protein C4518_01500 [Desulfobacteraceae bacterium]|nr:MAG: hypothetical protein C4518_01500 [Desulfobacteraceae bacterium]